MTSRNDPCWCGSNKKWKKCHYPNAGPQNVASQYLRQYGILIKSPEQIVGIKAASKLAATILDKVCQAAKEGTTTDELNDLAVQLHNEAGAIAAPLNYGYPPFKKSICTSINEIVCHGIPSDRKLKNGDIINIDVTSILNGYYGDCSRMVMIGNVSDEKRLVVDVSFECLHRAIALCKPGTLISEIGQVITEHARANKCSVVHQFAGHGVGLDIHEPPQVPHNRNNIYIPLVPGMTFTIEPMINAGSAEAYIDPVDGWTATTIDGKPSAQWEHTLLITETGCEILTAY